MFDHPAKFSGARCTTVVPNKATHWIPVGLVDKVKKAETPFALKLVATNYSFSSYDTMLEICQLAFSE